MQTRDGYLWVGTFGGLVRFDGMQFKVFNPNNAPGLPSGRIVNLFEDEQGALWIRTEENYLVHYSAGRFQVCSPPGWGRMPGHVQGFAQTGGKLCLITPERQLIRFAEDQFALESTNWELLETNVNYVTEDSLGQVWVSTDKALKVFHGGSFQRAGDVTPLGESDHCILAGSHQGGCWVAANGRLRRFKRDGQVMDYGAFPWSEGEADCMIEDHYGQIWIGTYGNGLYRYGTNGTVLHLSTKDGLPGDFIRDIREDHEGDLWVGTESYGLVRLKPTLFRGFGRQQGLSGDCVLSVCEGVDGELWIGLNGDGVDRLKDDTIQHYGNGLTHDYVWSVFQDRNKTLWAGTWGRGLFRLQGDEFVPYANPGECSGVVCAIYGDPKGGLWVGQQRSEPKIVHLEEGKPVLCQLQSQFTGTDVRAICKDGGGNLWIGTQDNGVYLVKGDEQAHFGKHEGLSNESIRSLYSDKDGVLWIGTYGGGLNRLQDGKIKVFTTRDGLANDSLCYIAEDRHGYLWCGSLGGVFRVSKEELNQFARGQIRSIQCFSYTESDGLPSRECTGGCQPSGCQTSDGKLWFPTIRGLAAVDPENVPANNLPPPVAIEEVVMEGKTRNSIFDVANSGEAGRNRSDAGIQSPLKIPPSIQRLEFHYTGLSLAAPIKVRFKYKLEGLEDDWVEAGTRRIADYSHLQPRSYRFRVLACNNDGVWSEQDASLALIILPHFWQTWWFRALWIAAIVLLFVAVYEMRLASERKLVRMRLRIASDLHDEVGSNLGSIALLSELIPKQSPCPTEEISELRRIAVETAGSLHDIVWFLDPSGEKIEDLTRRMEDTARTLLPGIEFEFHLSGTPGSSSASLQFRRNVFLMFKEMLHNIAKHARASRVEIQVKLASRQFELRVRDDGIGFDEKKSHGGNGLKNLRRRAAALNGELKIESGPEQGTIVTLTAPIT